MKSFVALLSIKPHSPSVCPLYATVGAYRTFKYCLPIVRLCLTSMVTVTPKKIIEVYNKNWARSLGFNWRPSSTILVKILKHSCAFLPPQCWFGYYSLHSAPKYASLNIGEGEGHIWLRTKVRRVNVRRFRENSTQTVSVSTICDDDGDGKEERQKTQWIY